MNLAARLKVMLGHLAESIIVGLVSLRVMQGRLASRALNSLILVMAFVALRVSTCRSATFSSKEAPQKRGAAIPIHSVRNLICPVF
jgi:hypothetical protein